MEESVLYLTIEAVETVTCLPDYPGECQQTATNCTMLIEDRNDEPPEFNSPNYTASVRESLTVGEIIPFQSETGDTVRVSDADKDANG